MELGEFNINEDVKQVLLGSLLGDACLTKTSKNPCYCCGHSPKQRDYLFWKVEVLGKHFRVKTRFANNGPNRFIYILRTNHTELLNKLHKLYYIKSNKPKRKWEKIVNPIVLEELCPLGLAIWYCDDGSYDIRDKSCTLSTQGFSYEENFLLKEYFSRKWSIPVVVAKDYRKSVNKTYYRLVFHKKETEKFLNLIKDFVPESMTYKLGHISDKNKEFMESENKRYKAIRKDWYYNNHDKVLAKAERYRVNNRPIINTKRVAYYWNNLEKSQISGRDTMRKRRLLYRERVNFINHNYYHRHKDIINKERRERLIKDSVFREKKNEKQRECWNKNKERYNQKRKDDYRSNKSKINEQRREYYLKNRAKILDMVKKYQQENKAIISQRRKERNKQLKVN